MGHGCPMSRHHHWGFRALMLSELARSWFVRHIPLPSARQSGRADSKRLEAAERMLGWRDGIFPCTMQRREKSSNAQCLPVEVSGFNPMVTPFRLFSAHLRLPLLGRGPRDAAIGRYKSQSPMADTNSKPPDRSQATRFGGRRTDADRLPCLPCLLRSGVVSLTSRTWDVVGISNLTISYGLHAQAATLTKQLCICCSKSAKRSHHTSVCNSYFMLRFHTGLQIIWAQPPSLQKNVFCYLASPVKGSLTQRVNPRSLPVANTAWPCSRRMASQLAHRRGFPSLLTACFMGVAMKWYGHGTWRSTVWLNPS